MSPPTDASEGEKVVVHLNHRGDSAGIGGELCRGLVAAGIKAILVEPKAHGASRGRRLSILFIPVRAFDLARTIVAIRRVRPSLVHVHNARHAIVAPFCGVPYVVHCHGTDIRGVRPGKGWGRVLKPILDRAALVLVSTFDLLEDARGFAPGARYLPNPVDVDLFARPVDAPPPERDVLVGVSLKAVKGPELITAVARGIKAQRPSTTFTVVDLDGDASAELARSLGADTKLVPRTTRDALPGLLHNHRVAIGQMYLGALGVYELECLAAEVPVVMSARWNRRFEEPAPIIDGDTAAELTPRALKPLIDEDDRRARADAGVAWVRKWHGPEQVIHQLLTYYREVSGRSDTAATGR